MALYVNHPLDEQTASADTQSIATTPLACVAIAPFRGKIVKISGVAHGAFTTNCSEVVPVVSASFASASARATILL